VFEIVQLPLFPNPIVIGSIMHFPKGFKSAPRALSTVRFACCASTASQLSRQSIATTRSFNSTSRLAYFNYDRSHRPLSKVIDSPNFIDNQFQPSAATEWFDIHDPATNEVVNRAPQSTDEELRAAVASAEQAYPAWKATSVLTRQSIMFKFVSLIKENWDRLATSITIEQGKTFADAKGDVLRGLQVAETACGVTTQLLGDIMPVAKNMETKTYREPLGVVAAICPFSQSYSTGLKPHLIDHF
jgi:malonate-semialdehyde dehydrogenase (acetylating) / methylmalonate-semialdehyde dehydrogenase